MKYIDWDEIFFKAIFVIFIGAMLFILGRDIYYRANSEIKSVEMELEIFEKKIDKDTYTSMAGKTPVVRTDKDYYIYCGDARIEIEIDANKYNILNVGDNVIIIKEEYYYKDDIEPWLTNYYMK